MSFDRGGWTMVQAHAINQEGHIVGTQQQTPGQGATIAFLFADGANQSLGLLPNASNSYALDVNNRDVAVGYCDTTTGWTACLFDGGAGPVDLNRLIHVSGWTLQQATAINDAGEIVCFGRHASKPGQQRGFRLTLR
jgi:probable HAF family extracellular repeat protein